MFDRHGQVLRYKTEEALIAILEGDQLDHDNLDGIFKQAMMVDAASHGWNAAIDAMMDLDFSADDHDHKSYTPVGSAAMKGQTATVKKLVNEYGTDPTMRNNASRWFEGYTAVELAIKHEHYDIALFLAQYALTITDRFDILESLQETIEHVIKPLVKRRALCNWSKASKGTRKRWIVEYWKEQVARNNTREHDLQSAVTEWPGLFI